MTIGLKISLATLAINCLTFGLLAAFYYSPMQATGEYNIPNTKITLLFNDPAKVTRAILPTPHINASSVRRPS